MDIKKTFTENLQLLIAIGAVAGLVVGVVNFFILTAVTPLEKRVVALEKTSEQYTPLIPEFIEVKTNVVIIREDIKDIKTFLKIR